MTHEEIGRDFSIETVLQYGTLPKIYTECVLKEFGAAKMLLRSYVSTYIREEIQAEAIVRKLDAFQRFLDIASHANAQMIEFANISRECAVAMSTVKDFYSILEDTLIGKCLVALRSQ